MPQSSHLVNNLYQQLRQLASSRLSRETPDHTLTPTELVHEAYLRLNAGSERTWESEAHFFGAAAIAMRRILIDAARKKTVRRKSGALPNVCLDQLQFTLAMTPANAELLLDVDRCLTKFSEQYPNESELVNLRFFAGLTMEEAAAALGISRSTAQRRWAFAKANMHLLMVEYNDGD